MQHEGKPVPSPHAARGVQSPAEERVGVLRADAAVVGDLPSQTPLKSGSDA